MKRFLITFLLWSHLVSAEPLPPFSGTALDGSRWTQETLVQTPLTVLLFFSTSCRPCLTSMRALQPLHSPKITVVAAAPEPHDLLDRLAREEGFRLPILSTSKEVVRRYRALGVYPTVCLIGAGQILDRLQGTAAQGEELWLVLADRLMQRRAYPQAAQLYGRVQAPPLRNKAELGLAYALLKQGDLEASRNHLTALLKTPLAAQAWEGLAEIALKQNDLEGARSAVEKALQIDPGRPFAHKLQAEIAFREGKLAEAEEAIGRAESGLTQNDFTWQKVETLVARGNLASRRNRPEMALAAYEEAEKLSPISPTPKANKAVVLLEQLKQPKRALETLRRAQRIAPDDPVVKALLQQAQAALQFQQDMERRRHILKLVKELAERFRKQRETAAPRDEWSSPPLVLSVLQFRQRNPSLGGPLGIEKLLRDGLIDALRQEGIPVVEREVLDLLLEELHIGSSELADPQTQLRLGKIMAARLLALGTLYQGAREGQAFLRLVETETTRIVSSLSQPIDRRIDPLRLARRYAEEIQKLLKERYPLRGRIALVEADRVAINLGRRHQVRPGMVFKILGEAEPIELDGQILGYRRRVVGRLRVMEVEENFAMGEILEAEVPLAKGQKIELESRP